MEYYFEKELRLKKLEEQERKFKELSGQNLHDVIVMLESGLKMKFVEGESK